MLLAEVSARCGVVELIGEPGSGKTQIAMQVAVNNSKMGLSTAFVDADASFSPKRCESMSRGSLEFIYLYRPLDELDLVSLLHHLDDKSKSFSLIVVDSVASLFRGSDSSSKSRLVARAGLLLAKIAQHSAVVVTNQLTTLTDGRKVPALGESWSHVADKKFLISKDDGSRRTVHVLKSPDMPPTENAYYFHVDSKGITEESPGDDLLRE